MGTSNFRRDLVAEVARSGGTHAPRAGVVLKPRGGGARLGDVVALLVIDRLGRRPVLIGGFLVPEPGPRCVPRSRCPGVNGEPLILERIYPTSCPDRDPSHGGRSLALARAAGSAIGTFATLWALSHLGISGTMWIAAGIAGVGVLVSYFTAPETRGKSLHEAVWL